MDWKVTLAAFGSLFIAELGDKTQLACILLTAKTQKPASVFIGASLALVVITLIGVFFAQLLSERLPADMIKKAAAAAFVLIGMLMFFNKL